MKTTDNNSHPPGADALTAVSGPDVFRLAGLISTYAPHDGCFELCIPGVHAIRRSRTDRGSWCMPWRNQPCASSRKEQRG